MNSVDTEGSSDGSDGNTAGVRTFSLLTYFFLSLYNNSVSFRMILQIEELIFMLFDNCTIIMIFVQVNDLVINYFSICMLIS